MKILLGDPGIYFRKVIYKTKSVNCNNENKFNHFFI